jgi:5-methylcytosine-specific restriction endonuclease McrA
MAERKRDYRKEYDEYHARPGQVKNRAARNKARATAASAGKVCKGDGKEVDHKVPLSKGGSNSEKNTRVVSRTTNRKKGAKAPKK